MNFHLKNQNAQKNALAQQSSFIRHSPQRSQGFTLLEIVVVMVIIAVIAGSARLAFTSDNSQTSMKNTAIQLYRNFKFLQDEALLDSRTYGLSLDEYTDFDGQDFAENTYYDFKWLRLEVENPESVSALGANTNSVSGSSSSSRKQTLKRRLWQPLDEGALKTVRVSSTFNTVFELDGEKHDLAYLVDSKDKREDIFARLIEESVEETSEELEKQKEEIETYVPVIYFFPDGTLTDFRIVLQDSEDDTKGFVIKSVNSEKIQFSYLSEEDEE